MWEHEPRKSVIELSLCFYHCCKENTFFICFRAEALKESMSKPSQKEKSTAAKPNQPVRTFFPLGPDFSLNDKPQTIRAVQASESQGQRYTAEEIEVLR